MTEEEAISIGFPKEWLPTDLTVEEAKTNRCDVCSRIIKKYKDARWRLTMTAIRCDNCAGILQARTGRTWVEAKYVE